MTSAYLIWFRTELVVLYASVQIYNTKNVMSGFRVFRRSPNTAPGQNQQGLLVEIWTMSLGIYIRTLRKI